MQYEIPKLNSKELLTTGLIFLVCTVIVTLFSVAIVGYQVKQIRTQEEKTLEAVSKLKALQLQDWHNERISDIAQLADMARLKNLLLMPNNNTLQEQAHQGLEFWTQSGNFDYITLVDTNITAILHSGNNKTTHDNIKLYTLDALKTKGIIATDLYYDEQKHVRMDIIAPVLKNNTVLGFIIVGLKATGYISSLLQNNPIQGSKTLLLKQETNGSSIVLYADEPKHLAFVNLNDKTPLCSFIFDACDAYDDLIAYNQAVNYSWEVVVAQDFKIILAKIRPFIYAVLLANLFLIISIGVFLFSRLQDKLKSQKLAEALQNERLATKVINSAQEGIVVTDPKGKIVFANTAFCNLSGYSIEELEGKSPRILKSYKHSSKFYASVWTALAKRGFWHGEFWNKNKQGVLYPVLATLSAIKDDETGELTHYVGIQTDIAKLKEAQQKIEQLAYYDTLTSLPNRTLFAERASFALAMARRKQESLALIFIDLDRFKEVNDTLGHNAGDALLIEAANRLKASIREADTVSRLGGDEFVAVLPATDKDGAVTILERIIASFAKPCFIMDKELRITSSMGVALYPHDGISLEDLLKNADVALYKAKHKGRNTWVFYDPAINAGSVERLTLEAELERAIKDNNLVAYYQPKVSLRNGRIIGAEALVRWKHPKKGLISPSIFIPVAEATDLIVAIGDYMLNEVCKQLAEWDKQDLNDICVSVNLAARHFGQKNLTEQVKSLMGSYGIPQNSLEIEITESTLLDSQQNTIDALYKLKEYGISLAIDDFGTGYSNLGYLKRLPLNSLKIDQGFVKDLVNDSDDRMIAKTIVAMGKGLGLSVIAEGVETTQQQEILLSQGCEFAQGYLFGRPMPADEFLDWYKRNQK